jgi:hypothetical protein
MKKESLLIHKPKHLFPVFEGEDVRINVLNILKSLK